MKQRPRAEQFIAAATKAAGSLAKLRPDLPEKVVRLVDRALAFERSDRWPDARAMQEAVRDAREALRSWSSASGPPLARAQIRRSDALHLGPGNTLVLGPSPPTPSAVDFTGTAAPSNLDATQPLPPAVVNAALELPPGAIDVACELSDRWYVSDGTKEIGPVSLDLLQRGVAARKVPDESLVRHESWALGQPVSKFMRLLAERAAPRSLPTPITAHAVSHTAPGARPVRRFGVLHVAVAGAACALVGLVVVLGLRGGGQVSATAVGVAAPSAPREVASAASGVDARDRVDLPSTAASRAGSPALDAGADAFAERLGDVMPGEGRTAAQPGTAPALRSPVVDPYEERAAPSRDEDDPYGSGPSRGAEDPYASP
jgi:hypothetical protein